MGNNMVGMGRERGQDMQMGMDGGGDRICRVGWGGDGFHPRAGL